MAAQDATAWKQTLYMEIGHLVRKQRERSAMSLRDVAFFLDIAYQTVSRVEEGQGAPVHFLVAFAQLTACDVGTLIPKIPTTFKRAIAKSDA